MTLSQMREVDSTADGRGVLQFVMSNGLAGSRRRGNGRGVRGHRVLWPLVIALMLVIKAAPAAPVPHTQYANFIATLPGGPITLTFDGTTPNSLIPSGFSLGGITFAYDFGGVSLKIATEIDTGYSTTSSPHFLGTDDADILQDGDNISLSFAPLNAIGLYVITNDEMVDGDVTLIAGGAAVGLVATDVQAILADGSKVYFLGISDPGASFTGASLDTAGNGAFLFNIDDIITVAPIAAPDLDGDGIADAIDNCPNVANGPSLLHPDDAGISQRNTDGDAEGDACDEDDDGDLLSDSAEASVGTDRLNPDSDGDGVIDGQDQYPLDIFQAGKAGDVDGDGNLTVIDLLLLERFLVGETEIDPAAQYRADLHPDVGDVAVSISDLIQLQKLLLLP